MKWKLNNHSMILRMCGFIAFCHLNIIASAVAPVADASKGFPKLDYLFWQGNLRALNVKASNKSEREKITQEIKDKSPHIVAAFKAAYIQNKLRRARYYLFKKNRTIECYDEVIFDQNRFICGQAAANSRAEAKQSAEKSPSNTTKSKIASYNIN